jgi:hypothetical protein
MPFATFSYEVLNYPHGYAILNENCHVSEEDLFMAEILFVNSTLEHSLVMETNGTLLLGTLLLQDGFDVQVLRLGHVEGYGKDYPAFIKRFTEQVLEVNPKCVSFYTLWTHFHIMLRIAKELKSIRPDIVIVMAGPQVSSTASEVMEAMSYIDYVCYGEGENTVLPFFRALLRSRDQRQCSRRNSRRHSNGSHNQKISFHNGDDCSIIYRPPYIRTNGKNILFQILL